LTSATPTPGLEIRDHSIGQKPTRIRYGVMAFICVLAFLTYFDRVCIMRAQGDIERDLHISDQQMGMIFSVFWFSYALFEIPTGWLGDRFGARSTLTRIVLVWSLFTALSGSATGFVSLFFYRFLFGAGEAGAFPNMARVQWRWLPPNAQGRASGMIWLVARWGGAFAPLLFGTVLRALDSHGFHAFLLRVPGLAALSAVPTWRLAFCVCGVSGLIWIALFFPWFRDSPADKRSVNAAELRLISGGRTTEGPNARPRYSWQVWRALLTSRNLWGISMYYAFGSFCWSFFVSWVPKFLKQVHHLDYGKSELMSGLPLLFGGIACLLGGTLSDWMIRLTGKQRLGRAILPILGRFGAAAMILAAGHANSPQMAIFFMCVCMLAHDIGQGPSWASVVEIGGDYSGTAAGFVNTVTNLGGNVLQPILGAMIFTRYGWNALFVVFAVIYFVSAAMWLFIDPAQKFYEVQDGGAGFPIQPIKADRD
jgi:sugar phosphate permease